MKKLSIKYTPMSIQLLLAFLIIMLIIGGAVGVVAMGVMNCEANIIIVAGVILFTGMIVAIAYAMDEVNTFIECDNDIIKCRWLFIKWEIDLTKTKYFVYTIEPHWRRGGDVHTFNVEFAADCEYGEERKCLKSYFGTELIGEMMQGNIEELPLMQLYRYVEEHYPEKAKGFEKCV